MATEITDDDESEEEMETEEEIQEQDKEDEEKKRRRRNWEKKNVLVVVTEDSRPRKRSREIPPMQSLPAKKMGRAAAPQIMITQFALLVPSVLWLLRG
jgi:hypothetical protein